MPAPHNTTWSAVLHTIQRGITLLHHKAGFTNPCYYATLATMPLSLSPKRWHSIEV